MSQHKYVATMDDEDVTVTMGYDLPLNYVFCVVEGAADEPVYSNLDDDAAGITQQNVEYYRGVLSGLGISVPESMYEGVASDQRNQIGNAIVSHD